ncbi:MAG TPA: iron uptake system protein EfeO [Jatrophihabitantaceae bacterium]|jgi:iron uptake system component EfeO|nr:iron uptake system protein EfeO [Jatrophihabitantaceae bacterium]
MPNPTSRGRAAAVLTASLAVACLAACGGASKNAGTTSPSDASTRAGNDHAATVTITAADGCSPDRSSLAAGAVTFNVTNKDATGVSEVELLSGERIVGEKENLPPGFSGTFAVDVEAGTYTLYCPGAAKENTAIAVTGAAPAAANASASALLATGAKDYASYVDTQVGYLVASVQTLDAALHGTDLAAAQTGYKRARPYYEKIEPVAESFTSGTDNLDSDIDARAGDVPAAQWEGFHRIEMGLFADHSLTGLASFGDGLLADVKKLQSLTAGLTYKPYELANGAQELLDEVASTKITGEEERYSHIDLLDFQANDEGAEQAFADLQPGLAKIDASLAATISANFAALNTLVDKYRSSSDASGFVLYATLTDGDKQAFAAAVKAVQEPLSQVASKVATS